MTPRHRSIFLLVFIGIFLGTISTARAAWFDAAWQFRRPIDVTWDAERGNGDDLAMVEFYTAGHALASGDDIRIATDDGKLVPSRVLQMGPGDQVRVAFLLRKSVRKYFVYFGNEKPEPQKDADDFHIRRGMLLEMKKWGGGSVEDFKQIENSWKRSEQLIGRTIIERPFIGINPLDEQQQTISKLTGEIYAPVDGEYEFAGFADDRAAIYIDGNPLLFVRLQPMEIRQSKKITLTKGSHEMMVYHVDFGGATLLGVYWKRPDMRKDVEVIQRESFGYCFGGVVGSLEEHNKSLTADFKIDYGGECFFADGYSHRIHVIGSAGRPIGAVKYEFDFGDGQTSTNPEKDHVYLIEGVYPVKLTVHVGENSDTQTSKISVTRKYDRVVDPPTDPLQLHAKIVEGCNIEKMPANWLSRAVQLFLKSDRFDAMMNVANRIASEKSHPDSGAAMAAMLDASRDAKENGKPEVAAAMWDRVPRDSDLQPRAAKYQAEDLIWRIGDFEKAIKVLEPFENSSSEEQFKRMFGQAQILAGHADEGRKLLQSLPTRDSPQRRVAMSGALARSIEFYIDHKEIESGEETWEKWQSRYPADFCEGYSVLLRVKLIELRNLPTVAAKVAAAFATAMPDSPYSPQLLDRASKLLAESDSKKSAELRATLKQRYPEDLLSQEK